MFGTLDHYGLTNYAQEMKLKELIEHKKAAAEAREDENGPQNYQVSEDNLKSMQSLSTPQPSPLITENPRKGSHMNNLTGVNTMEVPKKVKKILCRN